MIVFVLFLADALSRSETYRAEVEHDLSKERSESAALRDLLCKIQSLNEGLAQDKIELNKIILLVNFTNRNSKIYLIEFRLNKKKIQFIMKNLMLNKTNPLFDKNLLKSNKKKSMLKMN